MAPMAAEPTPPKDADADLKAKTAAARAGGSARYGEKLQQEGKLPVRRRLELLLDGGFEVEDGLLAHSDEPGFGADGVVTAVGRIGGRARCGVGPRPARQARPRGPPPAGENRPVH